MDKKDAYELVLDAQEYLKDQDPVKFPIKAKKYLPMATIKNLAILEAALQVDYKLCPVQYVIKEMRKLREMDITVQNQKVNRKIEECIAILEHVMKHGVEH